MFAGLDEATLRAERQLPQPGGRIPAPGELATLQSYVNSFFDLERDWGADLLGTPAALRGWFLRRGIVSEEDEPFTEADVVRAVAVREGLRALLSSDLQPGDQILEERLAALNLAGRGSWLTIEFEAAGPRLLPTGRAPIDRALGVILSITARAMIDGRWHRLKACPGEDCGWAFYDHSRNNSGRWCSMAVCGGRAKARSHYLRHRSDRSQARPRSPRS